MQGREPASHFSEPRVQLTLGLSGAVSHGRGASPDLLALSLVT